MLKSIDDIVKNDYVNHFEDIAQSYGLTGQYIKYCTSQTNQEEVFFVCGTNNELVCSNNLNVESVYSERRKQYLNFNPSIAAFKITNSEPLLVHDEVIDYCQTAEFLRKIYKENHRPVPQMIPNGLVTMLKMAHHNACNPALSEETRNSYKRDIQNILKIQDNLYTDHGDKKNSSYNLYQQYDTQKSKLSNWFKKTFIRDKNRVSIEHLAITCKNITTIGVHVSDSVRVQNELRKRPEILYWMSDKPIGEKINCPNDQGFGSQKANDLRFIAFSFDSEYAADFIGITNRIEHPDAYKTTVENLISQYEFVQYISIPSEDYDKYTTAMNARGVKYCIKDTSTDAGITNLVIACNIQKNITDILSKISADSEKEHLYTSLEDRQRTAQNEALDKYRTKLESEMIDRASQLLGSSNVEVVKVVGDLLSDEPADDISF